MPHLSNELYAAMRVMVYGAYPSLEEVLGRLRELEAEINGLAE